MRGICTVITLSVALLAGCGEPAPEEDDPPPPVELRVEAAEGACSTVILWQPEALPGQLQTIDPAQLRPNAITQIESAFLRAGFDTSISDTSGFLVELAHDQCGLSTFQINDLLFSAIDPLQRPMDDPLIRLFAISPAELGEQTIADYNQAYIGWDRKLLGLPPATDEAALLAGENGYGRCNIYGIWGLAPSLVGNHPPIDQNQLFDQFFDASLEEVNFGEYDNVPLLHFLDEIIGIAAFGDCEEASQRAADYLDNSIARMAAWGTPVPVRYRLFLSEQVTGLSDQEIEQAWQAGEIAPEGLANLPQE